MAMGMPPLPPRRGDDEPHRLQNTGAAAFVGLCIGVVILVVSGCLFVGGPAEKAASSTTTPVRTSAPSTSQPSSTVRATTPSVAAPPAGRSGIGITFGKVTANDGTTIVVRNAFTSNSVKVRTDTGTKVHVLLAKRATEIRVGALVGVYGRQYPDGVIVAEVITGISIGTLPK
ncbi:DUF5666 domain-containing protein [Nocardia arthritidis]|uniref:DUF5666 domain-containing protein n=1 Tax=Nocardia arthritidis TaxID=228602 RepID=UPI000B243854|nr:DUF5666 domain-containing protein [Nocardia arthritidis]